MLIRNIYVYNEDGSAKQLQHVYVSNSGQWEMLDLEANLSRWEGSSVKIMDAEGRYTLMPGMLDSHVHGQGGPDFADVGENPESLPVIMQALGKTGLSYAMATLVSLELPVLMKSLQAIDAYVKDQEMNSTQGHTKIVGVHLEGPFIAKNCKGAHAESALQDSIDIEKFRAIINAAPHVTQWKITLAPDLPGALDFIRDVKDLENEGRFVKVFIGHANPEMPLIDEAIDAGAVGFTHLGNACQETCCRETRKLDIEDAKSRVVEWVLKHPLTCPPGVELISDGVHLSPSFVKLLVETIGMKKTVIITDDLGPAGLDDGMYKLGSLSIRKDGNNFFLADEEGNFIMKEGTLADGQKGKVKSLAGSAAPLHFCIQKYFEWTANLEDKEADRLDAIYAAVVTNPRISSLSQDAIARLPEKENFVIFDHDAQLVMSLCNGVIAEHRAGLSVVQEPQSLSSQSFLSGRSKDDVKTTKAPTSSEHSTPKPKGV